MRRTLRCTGCIATAALGLAVASSALHAEEPPVKESGPSLQEAAEAAAGAAQKAAKEAAEAAHVAGEAAAKVAEKAHRAVEAAAREAAYAAGEIAEQARGKAASFAVMSDYHLGLQISAVPRALNAQLKLDGNGVLVDGVTKGSPAEKSGIRTNDVLLSVDGAPVASAKGLHKVMQSAEGKEIKIKLLRGGEEQEVTVTPQKSDGGFAFLLDMQPPKREEVEEEIHKLESKIREKLKDSGLDVRMHLIRPGQLTSPFARPVAAKIPDDVSIQIRKQGEAPAEVEVKRGEKSWSANEDKLDELPDEVRPYAERMLNRGSQPFTAAIKFPAVSAVPGGPARPEWPGRPAPPSFTKPDGKTVTADSIEITTETPQTRERHRGNLEHRIEELSSEIERVSEKMDSLRRELKAQSQRGKE